MSSDVNPLAIFSERGAAKFLGISVLTLRSYRLQGRIKPESQSGVVCYTRKQLEKFKKEWLPTIEFNRLRAGWGLTRGTIDETTKFIAETIGKGGLPNVF